MLRITFLPSAPLYARASFYSFNSLRGFHISSPCRAKYSDGKLPNLNIPLYSDPSRGEESAESDSVSYTSPLSPNALFKQPSPVLDYVVHRRSGNLELEPEERESYQQLPEDNRFLDQYYDQLVYFRDKLGNKYADFKNGKQLLEALEKFRPESTGGEEADLAIVRFDNFIRDLRKMVVLNGGHVFILDVLIQSRSVFENFEKRKQRK